MPLCAAIDCHSKSYRKSRHQINQEKNVKITFHQFPKNEEKKLTWLKVMGLHAKKSLMKSPHLCSLHFKESDFDRNSQMRIRLKENAIPIPNIIDVQKEIENSKCELSIPISIESAHENNVISNILQDHETIEIVHHDKTSMEMLRESIDDKLTSESETVMQILQTPKHHIEDDHIYTDQRSEDTPRIKMLRKALYNQKEYYQQQLRTLKQRNKRQEKRIVHLTTILKELKEKSLLADEHAELLQTIGKCNVHLLKRLTAKSNMLTKKKKNLFLKNIFLSFENLL